MDYILLVIGVIVGVVIGYLIARILLSQKEKAGSAEVQALQVEKATL